MQTVSVIDNNFDKNITTSYFLSIQLMLDGFSFCVLDPISNEYIQFYSRQLSFDENINQILEKEFETNELLKLKYQKTFILYYSNKTTLIPSSLFSSVNSEDYFNMCFKKDVTVENMTFDKKVRMADALCLFQIPKQTIHILNNYLENPYYFCQTIPFIESVLLNTSNKAENHQIHLNIQNSNFETIVTSGNDLKLHNIYKFQNKKEFIYYVLYVFEQLKLDTKETRVYISGNTEKTDELYILLKKYIKLIELNTETRHFKFSNIFRIIPLQKYINLFNIPLCV